MGGRLFVFDAYSLQKRGDQVGIKGSHVLRLSRFHNMVSIFL